MEGDRNPATSDQQPASSRRSASGFTLLELLVALTILVFAFAIIWETFSGTVRAWQRGGQLLDELRHGDFVMEQLVSALRSAAFFRSSPGRYGFRLETGSAGSYPGDKLSWVTTSSAFIPPDSPLAKGTHRIIFSIEDNDDGDPAVCIRAYDPLLEDEDTVAIDRWFVSTEVQGIQCRVYNPEEENWENSWEGEQTNSLPSLVEITLYMDPIEEFGDPVKLKRVVEIPIAPAVTNAVQATGTAGGENTGAGDGAPAAGGESSGTGEKLDRGAAEAERARTETQ